MCLITAGSWLEPLVMPYDTITAGFNDETIETGGDTQFAIASSLVVKDNVKIVQLKVGVWQLKAE